MPIYEFYCPTCHTLYSFFSAGVNPKRKPHCPKHPKLLLERRPSTFATLKHSGDEGEGAGVFDQLDDATMEGAFETLAQEMDGLEDADDPRLVTKVLRRFGDLTGLELGPRMQEALVRLESGEDPEAVEAELERDLPEGDDEELSEFFRLKRLVRSRSRPRVDPELYFFED